LIFFIYHFYNFLLEFCKEKTEINARVVIGAFIEDLIQYYSPTGHTWYYNFQTYIGSQRMANSTYTIALLYQSYL
tara:strand:- start:59 stop:283 length:225 start_codon:yes stop_codon:yes gene_type:complete